MAKTPKKKLTPEQRKARAAAKKERHAKFQWVMMNGRQVMIPRPQMVEGLPVEEFIARNADPIWLMQNGEYEALDASQCEDDALDE